MGGVFMQETFRAAATNDRIMMMQKTRAASAHVHKMRRLFQQADTSGDGYINLDEFKTVLSDTSVRLWLASMDMEVGDAERLFLLIDNGDGLISADELIAGVSRLKGSARSIDLA